MEEDVELPNYLYELETDEMIEWLSQEETSNHVEELEAGYQPSTQNEARALLTHYIQRVGSGDKLDPRVESFTLNVLKRLSVGLKPWEVGKGEKTISFSDERWRGTVIKVLVDLGATQIVVSKLLGVSERSISSWLSYGRKHAGRDLPIYNFILELLDSHCSEAVALRNYKIICSSITNHREVEYKARRKES
ncbi:hypothetical protein [Vibrio parahaemolyticus]|uniref:hypothetical protein n=1 Tax=Vibrio parahaemolyticus TaxID=670 RepID=UPI0038925BC5